MPALDKAGLLSHAYEKPDQISYSTFSNRVAYTAIAKSNKQDSKNLISVIVVFFIILINSRQTERDNCDNYE
jgi:hypothetical protein